MVWPSLFCLSPATPLPSQAPSPPNMKLFFTLITLLAATPTLSLEVCGNFCGPKWCNGGANAECSRMSGSACTLSQCSASGSTDGSCADWCCKVSCYSYTHSCILVYAGGHVHRFHSLTASLTSSPHCHITSMRTTRSHFLAAHKRPAPHACRSLAPLPHALTLTRRIIIRTPSVINHPLLIHHAPPLTEPRPVLWLNQPARM